MIALHLGSMTSGEFSSVLRLAGLVLNTKATVTKVSYDVATLC